MPNQINNSTPMTSYQYSTPIPDHPSACINTATSLADKACQQCISDLKAAGHSSIQPGPINSHSGNGIALMMPEALPERIGAVAYFIEMHFAEDGK
jgi:hypothetical protein